MTNNSSTSITKPQKCVLMRNDIEIWIDEEKSDQLDTVLLRNPKAIIKLEGRSINLADYVGTFLPIDLEERSFRKQGMHKCNYGKWHAKDEDCQCGRQTNTFTPPTTKPVSEEALRRFRESRDIITGQKLI